MKKPQHCVVFDLDGTLTRKRPKGAPLFNIVDDVMPEVAKKAMYAMREKYEEIEKTRGLTANDSINWFLEGLVVMSGVGFTVKEAEHAILNSSSADAREGVKKCFQHLKSLSIPIAVVSFGVAPFIRAFLKRNDLTSLVDRIYGVEFITDHNDRIVDHHGHTIVHPENKDFWSRQFADEWGIAHDKILAVGDSTGDRRLGHHKHLRIGVAHDEQEKAHIQPHMGHVVITDDFTPVHNWLLTHINQQEE
jgi:HAD superfamily phosphoserine phosphatase-like hydrolase